MKKLIILFFCCYLFPISISYGQNKKIQYFKDFDYFTLEGIQEVNWWKKGKMYIKVKHKTDSTFLMKVRYRKPFGGFKKSTSEVLKTKQKIMSIRQRGGCIHLLGGCFIDTTYHFLNRVICFKRNDYIFVHFVEKLDEIHLKLTGGNAYSEEKYKEYLSEKSKFIPNIKDSGWAFEILMTKKGLGYHIVEKTQSYAREYDKSISLFWFLYNSPLPISPLWR